MKGHENKQPNEKKKKIAVQGSPPPSHLLSLPQWDISCFSRSPAVLAQVYF